MAMPQDPDEMHMLRCEDIEKYQETGEILETKSDYTREQIIRIAKKQSERRNKNSNTQENLSTVRATPGTERSSDSVTSAQMINVGDDQRNTNSTIQPVYIDRVVELLTQMFRNFADWFGNKTLTANLTKACDLIRNGLIGIDIYVESKGGWEMRFSCRLEEHGDGEERGAGGMEEHGGTEGEWGVWSGILNILKKMFRAVQKIGEFFGMVLRGIWSLAQKIWEQMKKGYKNKVKEWVSMFMEYIKELMTRIGEQMANINEVAEWVGECIEENRGIVTAIFNLLTNSVPGNILRALMFLSITFMMMAATPRNSHSDDSETGLPTI